MMLSRYFSGKIPLNSPRKILALSLVLVISAVALYAVGPVSATAETVYQNPVTAAPPLIPPTTASCTVILAQSQPSPVPAGNGSTSPAASQADSSTVKQ